jgi:hypothetical protein
MQTEEGDKEKVLNGRGNGCLKRLDALRWGERGPDPLCTPGAREWKVLLHPDGESRSDEALRSRLWPLPGVVLPFFRHALLPGESIEEEEGVRPPLKKENLYRGPSQSRLRSPDTMSTPGIVSLSNARLHLSKWLGKCREIDMCLRRWRGQDNNTENHHFGEICSCHAHRRRRPDGTRRIRS